MVFRRMFPFLVSLVLVSSAQATSFSALNAFLADRFWGHGGTARVICAHERLGGRGQVRFLWVVCGQYVQRGGSAEQIAGESGPKRLTLDARGRPLRVEGPRDGSLYSSDLHRLFPLTVRWRFSPMLTRRVLDRAQREAVRSFSGR